jgi:Uncharacterized protein involved in formation of curli polymers
MRRAIKGLRFSLLALLFCAVLTLQAEAKPRLAVRAFDNKTDGSVPADAITEMMTTELYNAELFELVEREKLDYVAEEIRLGQSGLMDMETAPEVGKVRGAQYTMTGAVTQYYYNASGGAVILPGVGAAVGSRTGYVMLDIRIIDNATGQVVYAAAEEGASNQTIGGGGVAIGGFASGKFGGILAAATRKSVVKHVESMKSLSLEE